MDLFGKKRIAELEKENKKLQEEKDSLKLVIDNENNKVRELEIENRDLKINFDSRERALKTLKDDRVEREKQVIELNEEIKMLEYENGCMKSRIVSIEELFKSINRAFICDFRKARGRALNASNKRIRNKQLNKMAASMEKIIKEIAKFPII